MQVVGGLTFAQLDAGLFHTCGVTTDARAFCWGDGGAKLGTGSTDTTPTPAEVSGGLRFVSVSAGWRHTCGVTGDGDAYCWGSDVEGLLGNGPDAGDSLTPVPVVGGIRFVALSAGGRHTCGLGVAGKLYCWGDNGRGPLGNGMATGRSQIPVAVLGDDEFTAVMASAHDTSCGIRIDGILLCWGHNDVGQLGRGARSKHELTLATPTGLGPVRSVSGGGLHVCAVGVDGTGYCWGSISGAWGELGDGRFEESLVPVQVAEIGNLSSIAAGPRSTCGVTTDNVAYCWGWNFMEGDLQERVGIPRRVPGQR